MNQNPLPNMLFAARAASDGRVHVVRAEAHALAHANDFRTSCHQPVVEVYAEPRPITCIACSRTSGVASVADFPRERVL